MVRQWQDCSPPGPERLQRWYGAPYLPINGIVARCRVDRLDSTKSRSCRLDRLKNSSSSSRHTSNKDSIKLDRCQLYRPIRMLSQ